MEILKRGEWPQPIDHKCHLPGWRERRRLQLSSGAIVRCWCGRKYKLTEGEFAGPHWTVHDKASWQEATEGELNT